MVIFLFFNSFGIFVGLTFYLNVLEILWKMTFEEMDSVALGLAAIHGSTN